VTYASVSPRARMASRCTNRSGIASRRSRTCSPTSHQSRIAAMTRTQLLLGATGMLAIALLAPAAAPAQVAPRGNAAPAASPAVDWAKTNAELPRLFQALIRIDTQDPPGNETKAVNYIKQVLEAEGIPVTVAAK